MTPAERKAKLEKSFKEVPPVVPVQELKAAVGKTPPKQPAVKNDLSLIGGWDLSKVESDFLVAELVRRGHRPLQLPQPKKGK